MAHISVSGCASYTWMLLAHVFFFDFFLDRCVCSSTLQLALYWVRRYSDGQCVGGAKYAPKTTLTNKRTRKKRVKWSTDGWRTHDGDNCSHFCTSFVFLVVNFVIPHLSYGHVFYWTLFLLVILLIHFFSFGCFLSTYFILFLSLIHHHRAFYIALTLFWLGKFDAQKTNKRTAQHITHTHTPCTSCRCWWVRADPSSPPATIQPHAGFRFIGWIAKHDNTDRQRPRATISFFKTLFGTVTRCLSLLLLLLDVKRIYVSWKSKTKKTRMPMGDMIWTQMRTVPSSPPAPPRLDPRRSRLIICSFFLALIDLLDSTNRNEHSVNNVCLVEWELQAKRFSASIVIILFCGLVHYQIDTSMPCLPTMCIARTRIWWRPPKHQEPTIDVI